MRTPVPDRDVYLARWAALHGGYDPARGRRLVRAWLTLVHALARPFAVARVPPSAVTAAAVAVTATAVPLAAQGGRWPLLGAVVVVLSGLLDSLDGAVAILTGRVSAWGYVLDSVADRCGDALYLLALWALGAPGWLVVVAGGALGLLEYTRARAGNAGFGEIGVVTVGERPTRIILAAAGLLAAGVVPGQAGLAGSVAAAATAVVGAVGLGQLAVTVHAALAAPGSVGPPEDLAGPREDPAGAREDPAGAREDLAGTPDDPTGSAGCPTGPPDRRAARRTLWTRRP